jgi:hypothetical protein
MFFAYAIISGVGNNHILYTNTNRPNFQQISEYLRDIKIKQYQEITTDLSLLSAKNTTIWVSPLSSYAIYNAVVNKDYLVNDKESPIKYIKAVKTEVEMRNFRECQVIVKINAFINALGADHAFFKCLPNKYSIWTLISEIFPERTFQLNSDTMFN